jgi:fatty-acyl-CoA synthase
MIAKLFNCARFFKRVRGVLKLTDYVDETPNVLVPDEIETSVDKFPDKPCILFEDKVWTYEAFEARANRLAHWALAQGFNPGDTVALVLENCPDYPAVWFGLSKVGVETALVNCHLEGQGLTHCINIVGAKAIIASGAQAKAANQILGNLDNKAELWDFDGKFGQDFEAALEMVPSSRPDRKHREGITNDDVCTYIYTSGTTGLPKAAKLIHNRMRRSFRLPVVLADMSSDDKVYIVLPLYHITGGGLAMGGALFTGATTILKRKFSASDFWRDVSDHDATLFVYIGELCRYLLNTEPHPKEASHTLRAGFGNGLRGDVWAEFVGRFKVPSMRELYGSTEGNVNFLNLDGKVGAIGQLPRFLDKKMGVAFVKFDVERELPIRDENGFCIKCAVGEVGEAIGRISNEGRESFQGYHDKKQTEKKILLDVFETGDKWFRTGDLMRRDDLGYVYFVDRIGDTFRWKSENVATNEVGDVLSKFDGIEMANVYGVEVPGCDGRAGMASITLGKDIEFAELSNYLKSALPAYAVPLFLRVRTDVDTTGTFKFRKVEAVKERFDLEQVKDPIWFLNPETKSYMPLAAENYQRIIARDYRF